MRSSLSSKRLDIQGLRAVAVLAVVANHLTGFPAGGFVGVDIFFVISGFVITIGLVREHEKSGSISFRNFYFRRVARIMPASTLAVVCTIGAGYFVFFTERANSILVDGAWAFLFSANWRFALDGTDYWAEGSPVSPLQHYWSLGVEEQFYFVWPLLALLVLSIAVRVGLKKSARRGLLGAVLAVVIAISFAWAVAETSANAQWAYFSTMSRAWELGVGALLAVVAPALSGLRHRVRTAMGWAGVIGIVASILTIEKSFAFPAPWAALPVAAVALIIIAGTGGDVPGFNFLTNPVSTYVGNISYSFYLWHFPVIVIMGAVWPAEGVIYYPALLTIMFLMAVASYEFVEIPAQRRLTAWRANGFGRIDKQNKPSYDAKRYHYLGLGALVVAITVVTPMALHSSAPATAGFKAAPVPPSNAEEKSPTVETNESRLTSQIEAALAADSWPELTPSLDQILIEGRPDEERDGCGETDLQVPNCEFGGDKDETVVVLGDSTAITLLPTVRLALGETYNVRGMTRAGCISVDVVLDKENKERAAECEAFKINAIAAINEIKPSMVLISNTSGTLNRLSSGTPVALAGQEWQDGTQRLLEALKPSGAKIVMVSAPPSGKPPEECATRTSTPLDCVYQIPQDFYVTADAMTQSAEDSGAKFIDTRGWFCDAAGNCPAFVGQTLVKRDNIHTSKQYAAVLVPVFKDALAG